MVRLNSINSRNLQVLVGQSPRDQEVVVVTYYVIAKRTFKMTPIYAGATLPIGQERFAVAIRKGESQFLFTHHDVAAAMIKKNLHPKLEGKEVTEIKGLDDTTFQMMLALSSVEETSFLLENKPKEAKAVQSTRPFQRINSSILKWVCPTGKLKTNIVKFKNKEKSAIAKMLQKWEENIRLNAHRAKKEDRRHRLLMKDILLTEEKKSRLRLSIPKEEMNKKPPKTS